MPVAPTQKEFEYILERERDLPEAEQTVFQLKILGWRESRELERIPFYRRRGKSLEADTAAVYERALAFGLLGWRNFLDDHGEPVEFEDMTANGNRKIPEHILDLLAPYAKELVDAITERADVSRDEAKN